MRIAFHHPKIGACSLFRLALQFRVAESALEASGLLVLLNRGRVFVDIDHVSLKKAVNFAIMREIVY